jgi:hypothetical protein
VRNHRDNHFAHNIDFNYHTVKSKTFLATKYDYERRLLNTTMKVVNGLKGIIENAHFSFDDSLAMAEKRAEYLWNGCKFTPIK